MGAMMSKACRRSGPRQSPQRVAKLIGQLGPLELDKWSRSPLQAGPLELDKWSRSPLQAGLILARISVQKVWCRSGKAAEVLDSLIRMQRNPSSSTQTRVRSVQRLACVSHSQLSKLHQIESKLWM